MAKSKEIYEWIVGVGGTEVGGVNLHKFVGTENEAKKHLVSLVKNDRANDEESFEDGTLYIKDVEYRKWQGTLYACGNYSDYHIDYEARKLSDLPVYGKVVEEIRITCYCETETWTDREKAKAFYMEAMANSEGSERERYTNIYMQLCEGRTDCNDEEEYY